MQGKLSGVNPMILGAIAQEESNFEIAGAGYNSAGYGGYFGLGAYNYPGGNSETVAQLETNSPAAFNQQAITAAAEFASLLQKYGSVTKAESAYQTGDPNAETSGGAIDLVNQALSGTSQGATAVDTAPGTASAPPSSTGTTAGGAKLLSTPLGDVTLPTGLATRIVLAVLGIAVLAIAVNKLFDSQASAPEVIMQGGQQAGQQAQSVASKANEGRSKGAGMPVGKNAKPAPGPVTRTAKDGVKFGSAAAVAA